MPRKPAIASRRAAEEEPARQPEPERAVGPIFPRATWLVGLLVALDLWSSHHLGYGLSRQPALYGTVMTSLMAGISVVDRVLGRKKKKEEEAPPPPRWLQVLRRLLLATPVLVILTLLAALLMLSYSSLMILADPAPDFAKVGLRALDEDAGKGRGAGRSGWIVGDPARVVLRTGPFGRPYRLSLPGYVPAVVTVPAFAGLRLVPDRDLRRPPSLLLRPPPTALSSLQNGGTIEVAVTRDGRRRVLASERCGCRASFLLGRPQPIPADAPTQWRLELLALGAVPEESPQFAQTLLAWKHPRPLASRLPGFDLAPGMPLEVRVRSRAGREVAVARPVVGEETLLDVLLEVPLE